MKTREAYNKDYKWAHVVNSGQLLISSLAISKLVDDNRDLITKLNVNFDEVLLGCERKNIKKKMMDNLAIFFHDYSTKNKSKRTFANMENLGANIKTTLITGKEQLEEVDERGKEMVDETKILDENARIIAQRAGNTNKFIDKDFVKS